MAAPVGQGEVDESEGPVDGTASETRAYVALGSNLGDSRALLTAALAALSRFGVVVAQSALYRTPPLGPPQPDYLNAVAALDTALGPEALLHGLKAVERELGRTEGERWGPRLIDLDLLLLGDETFSSAVVTVPHPELARRAFVLVPLAEIAPALRHPVLGTSIAALLHAIPAADRAAIARLDTVPSTR